MVIIDPICRINLGTPTGDFHPITSRPCWAHTHHSTRTGAIEPRQPVNSDVSLMNRRTLRWLLACFSIAVALWAALRFMETQHWLSRLPTRLGVERVLYAETDSWGFGPGGNESGVILYELPSNVSGANPSDLAPELRWETTPLQGHREWFEGEGASRTKAGPLLYNYLNRYGFGITVKTEVESEIDHAVSAPGSWYAYTRSGVIVLMPLINRVAYVYAG